MQDYHDLLIWKRAMPFVQLSYKLCKLFPQDEQYGLTSQFRRAAVSVVANIVEGGSKPTDQDFIRYLYIAKGSLNECACFIEIAFSLEYINVEQSEFMLNKKKELDYLLHSFITSIKK